MSENKGIWGKIGIVRLYLAYTPADEDEQLYYKRKDTKKADETKKIKEKLAPDKKVHLEFDGKELSWMVDNKKKYSWDAVSGAEGFQNPQNIDIKDKGPIPEGKWILKQTRTQHYKNIPTYHKAGAWFGGEWDGGRVAWGNSRAWLDPAEGTDTKGRTDFSIHGGVFPGSAGCIDLAKGENKILSENSNPIKYLKKIFTINLKDYDKSMDELMKFIQAYGEDIDVIVKYRK